MILLNYGNKIRVLCSLKLHPRAVSTIEDILEVYGNKVTSINLIPSGGGVFEFHLMINYYFQRKNLVDIQKMEKFLS